MQEQAETVSVDVASNQDEDSIFRPSETRRKLEEMVSGAGLPAWLVECRDGSRRACIACGEPLTMVAVRSVSLCLNAQHIGDVQVEVLCQACHVSYLLHYRKACLAAPDKPITMRFCGAMLGSRPEAEPVPMSLIGSSENNLADAIVADAQAKTDSAEGGADAPQREDEPCQS